MCAGRRGLNTCFREDVVEEDTPKFSLHMKGSVHQAYGGTTSCPISPLGICIFSIEFYPCGSFYTGLTPQCLLKANCVCVCVCVCVYI